MEPIVLPDGLEITAALCRLYDNEALADHFIPLIAAEGSRVMNADQVAGLVAGAYTSVEPLLLSAGYRLSIIDLRTIALSLCIGSDREFTKKVQRALIEMRRLERQFRSPSFKKNS